MLALKIISIIIISYFIGNLSFARIFSKLLKQDITKKGSGNPGTMNMARSFGVKWGFVTLLCDAFKGAVSALYGYLIMGGANAFPDSYIGLYLAGIFVILGHGFPIIYKFKGGKSVACGIGVFAVANPLWLLILMVISALYLWFFDYGAIASLIVITAMVIIEGYLLSENIILSFMLLTIFLLIWFLHRKNFYRLLLGKENKVNFRKMIKKLDKKQQKLKK